MESTPVRITFEKYIVNSKDNYAFNVAQTTVPGVFALFSSTNGEPATTQEDVDAELMAALNLCQKKKTRLEWKKELEARRSQP